MKSNDIGAWYVYIPSMSNPHEGKCIHVLGDWNESDKIAKEMAERTGRNVMVLGQRSVFEHQPLKDGE